MTTPLTIPSSSLDVLEMFTPLSSYNSLGTGAAAEDDLVNVHIGTGSIKISLDHSATNRYVTHENISIDLSSVDGFFMSFFNDTVEQAVTNGMTIYLATDATLAVDRWVFAMSSLTVVPGWNILWINKTDFSILSGTPDFADPIQSLRVRIDGTSSSKREVTYDGLFNYTPKVPSIIMTFDDGFDDTKIASDYATPRGVPMTHYIIPDKLGAAGYITAEVVNELQAVGDYIGTHYEDRWDDDGGAAPGTALARMQDAKTTTKALVPWQGDHASWPQGQLGQDGPNGTSVDGEFLGYAADLFTTTRATADNLQFPDAARLNRSALNSIPLNSTTSLAQAIAKVDESKTLGLDLNFYGHKLGSADSITWAVADFEALIDYIEQERIAGRVVCRTIDTWWRDIQAVTTPVINTPGNLEAPLFTTTSA